MKNTTPKTRHQFTLDQDLGIMLERLCRKSACTKSDIIAKAVAAFLEQRGESEAVARLGQRLDRISRSVNAIQTDTEMVLESLALFIRYSITLNAHTPLPDQATQAVARERYLQFVDQVGRQIASGRGALKDGEGIDKPANKPQRKTTTKDAAQ